MYIITWGC